MRQIIFHPYAQRELTDAVNYYNTQRSGLGLELLEEVENAINFLRTYPQAGVVIQALVRRLVLPQFPYSILYRLSENDSIRILAIAHHRRKPLYWMKRQ